MAELVVRVQPRSSRSRILLSEDGSIKLWTTAPPVDGEANKAVCELVAKALRVPKSCVSVIRGDTSRTKTIQVEGLTEEQVWAKLRDLPN